MKATTRRVTARALDAEVARRVATAFLAGRRAAWLPSYPFEDALARPLIDVRRELRIASVAPYARMGRDWTRESA